jgi:hypothetical protein
MARGGKREGAGRKPGVALPPVADKTCAGRLLDSLNRKEASDDSYEVQQWRLLSEAQDLRIRLDARKFLYDKRDGKATQPIDHGGNLDHTIIFDMPGPERERKK